ncbi:MAG: FAD:protein FMN transferase [Maritimibacter sp.]|uniref:FAD:protein FMN transferase n=1 Tax=Maritimibacter sp. TaxID=2003363 RepID=UPI001DF00EBF|nr:FAD:protein FMN transferase [Maritimibacter sp.]MBL6427802.1 FAD:protein FMN transferase [Maritimibacter sp.]
MRAVLSRRRFLAITGAAVVAGRVSDAAPVARWQGPALGTLAEVRLVGIETPGPIFAAIEAELGRIDRLFSLYRADSALVRLNRDGVLARPDPAFLELLTIARSVHHATEGAFDPTVQPLFALHAKAAAEGRAAQAGDLETVQRAVGFERVTFNPQAVRFLRPGMAMTLNGIAQGYASDRIAALLRAQGQRDVMVNAGEVMAMGQGPTGPGWAVRLPGTEVRLRDQAVATSHRMGTQIDAKRGIGHIFDPSLRNRGRDSFVSVVHDSAAIADAISTASIVMENKLLKSFDSFGAKILLADAKTL